MALGGYGGRLLFLALLVFALSHPVDAEQAKRTPRLCFLTFDPGTTQSNRFNPFFQRLRDLGYADGKTITIAICPQMVEVRGFPLSPMNVYDSKQTSSW